MEVGYRRVSTISQKTDRQLADVKLEKVFTDKASAKDANRPQLQELISFIRVGDTVHVHSIDRLARDLRDLQDLIDRITGKGASVKFHKENLHFTADSSDPMSKLLLLVMGAFSEFERAIINERRREGVAEARKKGVVFGAPTKLTDQMVREIKDDLALGIPKSVIARKHGISRPLVYKAEKLAT